MPEYNYYNIREANTGEAISTFYGTTNQMYALCNHINQDWKDNKGKVAVAEIIDEKKYQTLTKNLAKKLFEGIKGGRKK